MAVVAKGVQAGAKKKAAEEAAKKKLAEKKKAELAKQKKDALKKKATAKQKKLAQQAMPSSTKTSQASGVVRDAPQGKKSASDLFEDGKGEKKKVPFLESKAHQIGKQILAMMVPQAGQAMSMADSIRSIYENAAAPSAQKKYQSAAEKLLKTKTTEELMEDILRGPTIRRK